MGMVTAGLLVVCQESRPYQEDCEGVFVQTILRVMTHLERKARPLVSSNHLESGRRGPAPANPDRIRR